MLTSPLFQSLSIYFHLLEGNVTSVGKQSRLEYYQLSLWFADVVHKAPWQSTERVCAYSI